MPTAKVGIDLHLMGRKALTQAKTITGKIGGMMSKIKPIGAMLLGAGGAYALTGMVRKTVDFDLALTRLSIQAHKSKEDQADLRKEWLGVATETGKAKDEIAGAGQSIIDATGSFDFMKAVMKDLALLSQVTGADMGMLGNVVSDLRNNFNLTGPDAIQMLRVMTEQGEMGKLTLNELAVAGPRAFSAMKLAGIKTTEEIKHAGAELQVFRRGFATAEETTTAYLGTIARLAAQAEKLKGKGVRVFEEDDPTKMRKVSDVLMDIFNNIGTNAEVLSELFGVRNVVGVQAMATAFMDAQKEGRNLDDVLAGFNSVTGESARFQNELNRIMGTTGGKLMTFQQKLDKIFDEAFMANVDDLAGYLPELTKFIKFMVENKEALLALWGASKIGGLAGGAGGLAAAGKALTGAATTLSTAGGALAAAAGVTVGTLTFRGDVSEEQERERRERAARGELTGSALAKAKRALTKSVEGEELSKLERDLLAQYTAYRHKQWAAGIPGGGAETAMPTVDAQIPQENLQEFAERMERAVRSGMQTATINVTTGGGGTGGGTKGKTKEDVVN